VEGRGTGREPPPRRTRCSHAKDVSIRDAAPDDGNWRRMLTSTMEVSDFKCPHYLFLIVLAHRVLCYI
jgi:hypothetical protein